MPREAWGADLYGDPCRECGFDWSVTPDAAMERVARIRSVFEDAVGPADGSERDGVRGWTVAEYVSHVADNLRQWSERLQGADTPT